MQTPSGPPKATRRSELRVFRTVGALLPPRQSEANSTNVVIFVEASASWKVRRSERGEVQLKVLKSTDHKGSARYVSSQGCGDTKTLADPRPGRWRVSVEAHRETPANLYQKRALELDKVNEGISVRIVPSTTNSSRGLWRPAGADCICGSGVWPSLRPSGRMPRGVECRRMYPSNHQLRLEVRKGSAGTIVLRKNELRPGE
ncbi:hypothetical protein BDV98DRAFT_586355 [Pterulicium gracile]|uniref:Uncharacterized protein n=1 Tax=Pterulicium gracile TaxID=1884261 RepID=A0A5C3Q2Z3_9AGAR|nr:hypothetical protein BDV98DRAFT_586355 [Pterula gracilis]